MQGNTVNKITFVFLVIVMNIFFIIILQITYSTLAAENIIQYKRGLHTYLQIYAHIILLPTRKFQNKTTECRNTAKLNINIDDLIPCLPQFASYFTFGRANLMNVTKTRPAMMDSLHLAEKQYLGNKLLRN